MRLEPRSGVEGVEAHHFHCRLTPLYLISDGFACIDFGVLLIDERFSLRELYLAFGPQGICFRDRHFWYLTDERRYRRVEFIEHPGPLGSELLFMMFVGKRVQESTEAAMGPIREVLDLLVELR